MSNQETAKSFLKMAASGEVRAAYEKYVAPNFIHHNQYFKGDRQSLMLAMEEAANTSPNKSIVIHRALEDGDMVVTYSHVVKRNNDNMEIAVVHMFRFEKGIIVELWDVAQIIDKNSPNKNGMF